MGPFVALVALLGSMRRLNRGDAAWWLAAVVMAVPWWFGGHPLEGTLLGVQVIAAWLLFRTAADARRNLVDAAQRRDVGLGLLIGLVGVTLSGLARVDTVNLDALYRFTQVVAWREHPTLFGHTVFVLSALVAIGIGSPRRSVLALAIGAVGVMLTGALEAVVAWLLVACFVAFGQRHPVARWSTWGLVALVGVTIAGAGTVLGLGSTGFLVALERDARFPNLLQGTEVPAGDWWHALDVQVTHSTVEIDGRALVGYAVTKTGEQSWARLQQMARLDPGLTTVSVYLQPEPGTAPGVDLWGRLGTGDATHEFNVFAVWRQGAWRASARGPLAIEGAWVVSGPNADGWLRAAITVRHEGESSEWYVGVTPDRTAGAGGRTTFAGLQVERGGQVGEYAPAPAWRGLDLRTARLPIWNDAWDAIGHGGWLGWGPRGLPIALGTLHPEETSLRQLPAHAHNAFLDAWVERGPLGLVGVLLLLVALAGPAIRGRDTSALAVIVGVVLMNLLDTSLMYGGVLYPLALLLGWRAGGRTLAATPDVRRASAPARLGLMAGDLLAAWTAVGVSVGLGAWADGRWGLRADWGLDLTTLAYLLLLWPLATLREGLYPGYGTTEANELRKVVQAAAAAGVAVVLASRLLPDVVTIPLANAVVIALAGTLLAPVGRGLSKRALLAAGAWGRPVVVIGGGATLRRVTATLRRRRLDGLMPVAVYTDDTDALDEPTAQDPLSEGADARATVAGVPVDGPVHAAVERGRQSSVEHAVVAFSDATPEQLQALLEHLTGAFPRVQFIPNLAALPSHGVYATDLDRMLALELRVGLLDPMNRGLKRGLDIVGMLLVAALAAPALLLIAIAVRLESPGPALYHQRRIGRHGNSFRMWKFRTMVANADDVLAGVLASDPAAQAEWERRQKLENDPRVTRVGRWLRKTSLDELPQLWNVLRGDMSIVGPRPIVENEVRHYGKEFHLYRAVRPGVTGYWQVSGRSRIPYPERVEYDSYYVRNWSLWLDTIVLARTIGVVVRGDGAY